MDDFGVLCIGCGALPEGDVNVDLFPLDRSQCAFNWDPKATPNFSLADSHKLPFADKSFREVRARHCLEHMADPLAALIEMQRVSRGAVKIWVPSPWKKDLTATHIFAWGPIELKNLMLRAGFKTVRSGYTNRVYAFVGWKTTVVNLIVRVFGFYTEVLAEGV